MRKIVYDNLIKVCIKTHLHKGAELILQFALSNSPVLPWEMLDPF